MSYIAWRSPSSVQGDLKGYELQFQSSDGQIKTIYFGPTDTYYLTAIDQRKEDVKIQVGINFCAYLTFI